MPKHKTNTKFAQKAGIKQAGRNAEAIQAEISLQLDEIEEIKRRHGVFDCGQMLPTKNDNARHMIKMARRFDLHSWQVDIMRRSAFIEMLTEGLNNATQIKMQLLLLDYLVYEDLAVEAYKLPKIS